MLAPGAPEGPAGLLVGEEDAVTAPVLPEDEIGLDEDEIGLGEDVAGVVRALELGVGRPVE